MQLLVSEIPEEGISIPFKGNDFSWEGLKEVRLKEPPKGKLFVEKKGMHVLVKGHFTAIAYLPCSRCLENYTFSPDITFQYTLRPAEDDSREMKERELIPEDLEYGYYRGDVIQLDHLIKEHFLLSIPMKPLCIENCKGLCSCCGANRNTGSCSCPVNRGGSPFDKLKNIII